ncbi:Alcohol acetyltransferase [Conoideocrella luteorostrata]|uniref:Alcohol acetyltransferase n=1 Tax=Conoideocrella luteorostrata TaxID=1105319 RepID=A0AAJ0CHF3_9HYPO|nr:Alcohol acetyltransferase [Conoideocrella luteorostrata]
MATESGFLRYASPNEQRTISREDLGFYHAVIIGAIYELSDSFDTRSASSFFAPLHQCISDHPFLSVAVGDMHTDKSFYQHVPRINLSEHIMIAENAHANDSMVAVESLLQQNVDSPFQRGIPPWKIIILPLEKGCFVAFSFSHTIGDGTAGLAFHHSFLRSCRTRRISTLPVQQVVNISIRSIPDPFDTPQNLPISWSFLLSPLASVALPSFVSKFLGLHSYSSADSGTWTGSENSYDPAMARSELVLQEVDAPSLANALRVSREHAAKFTGLFQRIIARAFSRALTDPDVTNFVCQTAVNMRRSVGRSSNEGGNVMSGCYTMYHRQDTSSGFSEDDWAAVASSTHALAASSMELQDQVIGLLRYLRSIRSWTCSKLGQRKGFSFELSNVGVFDEPCKKIYPESGARITAMAFAQPGDVVGPPLAFNLVSVKGGALVYTVTWQSGALGLGDRSERSFVKKLCLLIDQDLSELA